MRKLIVQVAALLLITGVAYLGLFQRQAVMGLFKQARLNAKGYTPAKSPEEALDRFRKAVKDRDYEAAASYCGGDFVEQINKAAPGARYSATLSTTCCTTWIRKASSPTASSWSCN